MRKKIKKSYICLFQCFLIGGCAIWLFQGDIYASDDLRLTPNSDEKQPSKINLVHQPYKIGVVDLSFVIHSIDLTRDAKHKMDLLKQKMLKEIQKKKQFIQKKQEDLQRSQHTNLSKKSERLKNELKLEQEKLNQSIKKHNLNLLHYERMLKRRILSELLFKIEWVRKQKGYDIILNKKDVLAYDPKHDLSSDVMELFILDEKGKFSFKDIKKD